MCGYVSTSLRNAVVSANASRHIERQRAAGNTYAVVRVNKNGTFSKPYESNLSAERAEEVCARIAGLNPGKTYTVINQ
jgi:hypothetical protein